MASPSLPDFGPSTSANSTNLASTPPSSVLEHDSSECKLMSEWTWLAAPDPITTSTVAATGTATTTATRSESSRRPSGVTTKTTTMMTSIAESSCDGGAFDDASSSSLQDEFPWHEVGINTDAHQRIPSVIFPALLHANNSNNIASPTPLPRFSVSSLLVDDGPSEGGESGDDESGTEANVSQCSITEKGKWKTGTDDEDSARWSGSPSPPFCFRSIGNSAEDWIIHTRPILQEYANRQTSLPLGQRLEVSIDEPSDFILGSLQLLVNRDRKDCTDRSRQLGPQLIENFVNTDRWAKEYFRSRHGVTDICNDVSTLLTIVMNGFYEGLVQLIDRLVEFALQQMRFCGRTSLAVEDFSFGYDFRMSQDLPFYVETSSRIREPLPIPAVNIRHDLEPVTTHSGRQVRPTKRVQEACEQATTSERRDKGKGKGPSQAVKGKRVPKGAIAPPRQRSSVQPCSTDSESDRTTTETSVVAPMPTLPPPPQKTKSRHTRHRPLRPSNLGLLPPISPALLSSEFPNENSASASRASASASASTYVSASGDGQNVSGRSGSDTTAGRPPPCHLKIVIPRRAVSKSLPSAVASSCGSTTTTTTATTTSGANTKSRAQMTAFETANEGPAVVSGLTTTGDTNASSTTLQTSNSPANGFETTNVCEDHAHGCLFGSVSGVFGGGKGSKVWPRCPSGPSVGDNTDDDCGRASGGSDTDNGRLCANGSKELTLNAGNIASGGSTSATIPNERTRTMQAGAKAEGEDNGDAVVGPLVEPPSLTSTQVRDTGDPSSSSGDRPEGINTTVDDERPASGSIDTRERETLPLVPPSDPEPRPGSGSGRLLRRRKRKLDECGG